jgi:signal transduction histidine kinase
MKSNSFSRSARLRSGPAAIALYCFAAGLAWMAVSDLLLPGRSQVARLIFITVTAALAYIISKRYGAGLERTDVDASAFPKAPGALAQASQAEARDGTLNALGTVAASIAHEINNPLAVVSSRIELILGGEKELTEEARDDLRALQRGVLRASRISRHLLAMARVGPGPRQPISLNRAVEEAILVLGEEDPERKVRIALALDPRLPPVIGDAIGMEQVLINLVANARDAKARQVNITSTPAPGRPGHLRLTVADDGVGIGPEALLRLFEPFYTTKAKGTGLGLWLSQRIVQEHGGTIEAQSATGKGTTFVITLPVIDEKSVPGGSD